MVPVPPMFLAPVGSPRPPPHRARRDTKERRRYLLSRSSEERALNDAVHADVSDILDKVDDNSFRLRCVAVLYRTSGMLGSSGHR